MSPHSAGGSKTAGPLSTKTDGKRKASGNNTYLRYLNEAKAGFPPPKNTELTEEQIEELTKIAEEVTKNDKNL